MSQIQEDNNIYKIKFNLCDLYSLDEHKKLFKLFPEFSNLYQSSPLSIPSINTKYKSLSKYDSEYVNTSVHQTKINKFHFFKIFLLKLKTYFEINENFIIVKTISILINEIDKIEKYMILNYNASEKLKFEEKKEKIAEKENKSSKQYVKIKKLNFKNISSNQMKGSRNNGLNNSFFSLLKDSNPYDVNTTKKKKVYFRVLDNHINKEYKTEINPFSTEIIENKIKKINKKINTTTSKTKIKNNSLSISELKKNDFSTEGLKIYIDSNNKTQTNNFSDKSDFNNDYSKREKYDLKNKSDLFNNSNNLYINIYEDKKNNILSPNISSNNTKTSNQIKIKEENHNININLNLSLSLLTNIETKDFNIFELDKKTSKNTLPLIGYYIFNRFGFHKIIKYKNFENWCRKITEGYNRKNPYHTDLHAADITQTCLVFFKIGKINEICHLDLLSKCSLFLSCICHDYKHPGLSNDFLKDSKNILAIKYNDNSILENMHISEAFKLTIDYPDCNIFCGMNSENYKQMRKMMISCVLFTDMINHKSTGNFLETVINNKNKNNNDKNEEKDIKQGYMNLLIHAADISNPIKKFNIYFKWAQLIIEEFLQQGDKEKELGLKCTYDRETMDKYQNQLGFINFIEMPFFSSFVIVFPKLKYMTDNLNNNKNKILDLKEKNKEKTNLINKEK